MFPLTGYATDIARWLFTHADAPCSILWDTPEYRFTFYPSTHVPRLGSCLRDPRLVKADCLNMTMAYNYLTQCN